ncbi:hypothetical protein P5673_031448, partial [Acropora cervicornis]
ASASSPGSPPSPRFATDSNLTFISSSQLTLTSSHPASVTSSYSTMTTANTTSSYRSSQQKVPRIANQEVQVKQEDTLRGQHSKVQIMTLGIYITVCLMTMLLFYMIFKLCWQAHESCRAMLIVLLNDKKGLHSKRENISRSTGPTLRRINVQTN